MGSSNATVRTGYRGTKRATRVVLVGLGARIRSGHGTQTFDDKPPAACCAWGARRPCTEL